MPGFFKKRASVPSVAVGEMRSGDTVGGVVVFTGKWVQDPDNPSQQIEAPYDETQQRAYSDNAAAGIKAGDLLWFDAEKTQPRTQAEIHLFNPDQFKDWALTSSAFRKKATADPNRKDDGRRRLFAAGKNINDATEKALAEIGLDDIVPGITLLYTLGDKEDLDGGRKANTWSCVATKATPETTAIAERFRPAKPGEGVAASEADDDDDAAATGDEPPF